MAKYICRRWAFDLSTWSPTLAQLTLAIAAVQPEERQRLMKFVFIEDFLSSLVGRLLMRKFVSESTGINYNELLFKRDARGKPYLDVESLKHEAVDKPCPLISFNVSHQGDFVVLAGVVADENTTNSSNINGDFGVGVDIMKIEYSGGKALSEFFRIMHNKFADNEWEYINRRQHTEADKLKAFMRHWCLKESYVKELGVGITIDLKKISFTVDPEKKLDMNETPLTSTTLRCNQQAMTNLYFEEHMLHPKYCAAIALRNCKPNQGKFEFLSIGNLLVPNSNSEDIDIVNYCREALKKTSKK